MIDNAVQPVSETSEVKPVRIQRATAGIDLENGRGLEVGPLCRPIVRKDEADVYYLDVHDTQGLKDYYATDPNVPNDEILEVDFPLITDDGVRTMAEAAASKAPYDWVVASHVIEHVPDVIGFLRDVSQLLVPGGRLSLIVPDRRYEFDALRPGTSVGAMLLAHYSGDRRPSIRAVIDHFLDAFDYSPVDLWAGVPADPDKRWFTPDQV